MIIIKSPREIALMREAGKLLADLFLELEKRVQPGVSTLELNDFADQYVRERGGEMAEKGYYGYPASVCASINEVILHGIPHARTVLKDGDIISLDIVVRKNGYCADACRTYPVGLVGERQKRLIECAEKAFDRGVSLIREGINLGDVQHEIYECVKSYGYSVPRDYTGHGIGREMHEDPYIPNYGERGKGPVLKAGMTLAIEPMILEKKPAVRVLNDGWTVVAKDKGLTAHYENTVLVTRDGYEILTK